QGLEFRQLVDRLPTLVDEAALHVAERPLQLLVGERSGGVVLEMRGGGVNGHGLHSAGGFAAPIGASSAMSARISAMWRAATDCPLRESLPAMFMQQPRSPASTVPAPVETMFATLASTIALEMSPYLTAKVPPKPQHTSLSGSSMSFRPLTVSRRRRGCAC